ncbi:hypothetical protein [Oligella ureolytica]|nr:hypothetical protein [Oligella ureolytica]
MSLLGGEEVVSVHTDEFKHHPTQPLFSLEYPQASHNTALT